MVALIGFLAILSALVGFISLIVSFIFKKEKKRSLIIIGASLVTLFLMAAITPSEPENITVDENDFTTYADENENDSWEEEIIFNENEEETEDTETFIHQVASDIDFLTDSEIDLSEDNHAWDVVEKLEEEILEGNPDLDFNPVDSREIEKNIEDHQGEKYEIGGDVVDIYQDQSLIGDTTYIHIVDENYNDSIFLLYKHVNDVLSNDNITLKGIPIDNYHFENRGGGTTFATFYIGVGVN
ncbi:hypothetical protein [Alkalicoccus chagannorensis]|uniref:hypothetical protein n=1 Tax=Alkalicoccus chagannorensis TaxID=427072 RepID=UPI00041A56A5|nr:hypothetical protein [Alkalicoccus chagannorensis]